MRHPSKIGHEAIVEGLGCFVAMVVLRSLLPRVSVLCLEFESSSLAMASLLKIEGCYSYIVLCLCDLAAGRQRGSRRWRGLNKG